MKKVIMIASMVVLVSGCSFISPSRSKAQSEIKQVKLLEEQNVQLTRIADSLEKLTK